MTKRGHATGPTGTPAICADSRATSSAKQQSHACTTYRYGKELYVSCPAGSAPAAAVAAATAWGDGCCVAGAVGAVDATGAEFDGAAPLADRLAAMLQFPLLLATLLRVQASLPQTLALPRLALAQVLMWVVLERPGTLLLTSLALPQGAEQLWLWLQLPGGEDRALSPQGGWGDRGQSGLVERKGPESPSG